MGRGSRQRISLALGLMVICLGPAAAHADAAWDREKRPNVVQIVLDDATWEMLSAKTTPKIWHYLFRGGARFREAIANSPLCCPSRANLITGQYGHNNGVLAAEPGYPDLIEPGNVLEAWLRRAGYWTAHVGKVMEGMPGSYPFSHVPPGWDDWYGTRSHSYYASRWWWNGKRRRFGGFAKSHITRLINKRALAITEQALDRRRPFYLNIAHLAPHRSATDEGEEEDENGDLQCPGGNPKPAGRLKVPFESVSPPTGPAFAEADRTDKPPMVQAWPEIDAAREQRIVTGFRCAVASLAEVDRGFGKLIRVLESGGALEDTAIILLSDNGFSWGQHGIVETKHFAYEENVRVPLVIRVPRALRTRRSSGLATNARVGLIDVAPTILKLTGVNPCITAQRCRPMDGRSLLAAARGKSQPWHANRALGIELARGEWTGDRWPCRYAAVRTPRGTYIRHTELTDADFACVPGEFVEAYDAIADPFQLDNLAIGPGGGIVDDLAAVHDRIATCAGIRGRDPKPGGGRSFCD